MARLQAAGAKSGRGKRDLSMTVFRAPAEASKLEPFKAAGVTRVLFDVPDKPRDEVLPLLDRYAALIGR